MQIQIIPSIIVVAYLVGMMLVGFIVGKLQIKDSKDYMLAGRRMDFSWWRFLCPQTTSAEEVRRAWPRKPSGTGE